MSVTVLQFYGHERAAVQALTVARDAERAVRGGKGAYEPGLCADGLGPELAVLRAQVHAAEELAPVVRSQVGGPSLAGRFSVSFAWTLRGCASSPSMERICAATSSRAVK